MVSSRGPEGNVKAVGIVNEREDLMCTFTVWFVILIKWQDIN